MEWSQNLSYQRDNSNDTVKFDNEANLTSEIDDFLSDDKIDETELKAFYYILSENNTNEKKKEILNSTKNLKDLLNYLPVNWDIYKVKDKINKILKLSLKSTKRSKVKNILNSDESKSSKEIYIELKNEARKISKIKIKKFQNLIWSKDDWNFWPNTFRKYKEYNTNWKNESIINFMDKIEYKNKIIKENKSVKQSKWFFERLSELFELNPFVKDFIWETNYKKLVRNLNRTNNSSMENDFKNIKDNKDYNNFISNYSRILAWKDESEIRYSKVESLKSKSILNIAIEEYYKKVNENDWSADKYWKELWINRSSKGDRNAWCAAFINWTLMKAWLERITNKIQILRAKWFLWAEFKWSWHVWIKSSKTALLSWNVWNKVNNNTVFSSKINRIPIGYVIPWDLNTKYINSNYKNMPNSIRNKSNYKISKFNYWDIPNGAIVIFDSYKWTR